MENITQDHRTVLGTLPFRPTGDDDASYATAAAVTEVVPFGADKVRKLLADLVAADLVETHPTAKRKSYRRATTEDEAWAADDAAEATRVDEVEDASGDAAGAPTVALGALESSNVSDVLGAMRAVRPVVAADGADEAPVTSTCTVCKTGITKDGRSWKHDNGDVSHKATTAKQREPREQGERPADAPPIYQKGALRDKILSWLQGRPEGESFTATTVAKAVGGQNGSVQFALDSFVAKGNATVTMKATKEGGREVKHYAAA